MTDLEEFKKSKELEIHSAIEELEIILTEDPNHLAGWNRLGEAYLEADRDEKAEAAFNTALKLSTDNPDAHRGLATIALRQKDFDAAQTTLYDCCDNTIFSSSGLFFIFDISKQITDT